MAITVSTGSVKAEPNVVPMIDVMLVLLIIFMVVTPAITSGFQAIPPDGINLKEHPEVDGDQVLGVDKFGKFYLNKHPVDSADLGNALKAIYDARAEDKVLYLKADRGLEYAKVLNAMDIATHAGVRVVGAITDQRPGTQSSVPGDHIETAKKQ